MAWINLRTNNRAVFGAFAVVAVLFNFALLGLIAWVAWHFIAKWW